MRKKLYGTIHISQMFANIGKDVNGGKEEAKFNSHIEKHPISCNLVKDCFECFLGND